MLVGADQIDPTLLGLGAGGHIAENVDGLVRSQATQGAADRAGVQATGQGGDHRHVGTQMALDGVHEEITEPLPPLARRAAGLAPFGRAPEAAEAHVATFQVHAHQLSRFELPHALEERFGAFVDRAPAQVVEQSGDFSLGGYPLDQGPDLRRQPQAIAIDRIVQGLHPKGVARGEQLPPPDVQHDEGVHAIQPVQRRLAPGLPRGQQDLGVGVGEEPTAVTPPEFLPQFDVVVDLAVVRHRKPAVGGQHRLGAVFGEIDDRQPPMSQHDAWVQRRCVFAQPGGR